MTKCPWLGSCCSRDRSHSGHDR